MSLAPHNDQRRDLFLGPSGAPTHLFEVKTDVTPYSIYTGVGQLMLNGATKSAAPARILVVPGDPVGALNTALGQLKVRIVTYSWNGNNPLIKNLKAVL